MNKSTVRVFDKTLTERNMKIEIPNDADMPKALAEFRKLAEKYQRIEDTLRTGEIHPEACNVIKNIMSDMSRLIHPLETSNQKP